MHRLNTKEDQFFFHKSLGVLALCNFIFRFFNLFFYNSFLIHSHFDMFLVGCHALLSLSSLIFHISHVRNQKAPMIYPEFRLHNIAFAMRSIICCFIDYFLFDYHHLKFCMKISTCFLTMFIADMATKLYPTDKSTMRGMPFNDDITIEKQARIKLMQSTAQVDATLMMLFNIDTAFSPLMAIQVASLLMTLVRKNFISGIAFHVIYNLTLWINVFTVLLTMKMPEVLYFQISSKVFCYLRFNLGINKYLGWITAFTLLIILRDIDFISILESENYFITTFWRQVFFIKYFFGEIYPTTIIAY